MYLGSYKTVPTVTTYIGKWKRANYVVKFSRFFFIWIDSYIESPVPYLRTKIIIKYRARSILL